MTDPDLNDRSRRRHGPWRALALATAAAGLATAAWIAWIIATLPDMQLAPSAGRPAVVLLDADGAPFARRGAPVLPPVDAATLPPLVTGAFVAIEDRRFYQHGGIDLQGMTRAALVNLRAGHTKQGGSTITQQLVKNTMLGPERTFARKLQEAVAAVWVDYRLGKDEVLSRYLSTAYFGEGAYGLGAAALVYFGKKPEDLTLAEAATLAGLVKAPSRLAPTRHPEPAQARATMVLAAMVETGRLAAAEAAAAGRAEPIPRQGDGSAAYFADWAYEQARRDLRPAYGVTEVRTTLDPRLQRAAERIVRQRLGSPDGRGVGQVALVAMRRDGSVVAMIGGRDHARSAFNRATQARRQPGSTFKLFTYLAAFRAGAHPDTLIEDAPVKIGTWTPENADGRYLGALTFEQAFARSSNVAAARVQQVVGTDAVVQAARDLGVTSLLQAVPSLTLGASEVTLLELTGAYASVAAGAYPVHPSPVAVGLRPSTTRMDWTLEQEPLLRLLQASAAAGPAGTLPIPTFGKSGTSQRSRDAVFVGFAGDLVVGVWAGNDDSAPMPAQSGGRLPALIWRDLVAVALADEIAAAERALQETPLEWETPTRPPAAEGGPPERGWMGRLRELLGV